MLPAPGPIGVESTRPPVFPVAGVQTERGLTAHEQRMRRIRQKRRQRDDFYLLGALDEAYAYASADATSDENTWEEKIQRSLDKIIDAAADSRKGDEFPNLVGRPVLVKGRFFEDGKEPVILSSTKFIPSTLSVKDDGGGYFTHRWNTKDGIVHRNFGPAITIPAENTERWLYKGVRHRWGGPAITLESGEKQYYVRAKVNGLITSIKHRLDGPAAYDIPGTKDYYYVGDRLVSEEDYPDAAAEWIYMFGRK